MNGIAHRNNFTLLRLTLSLIVVLVHCWMLLGVSTRGFIYDIGQIAVNGFFVISGYLIAKSWTDGPSVKVFVVHRALRIVPALVVALPLAWAVFTLCRGYEGNTMSGFVDMPTWTIWWEMACYTMCVLLGLFAVLSEDRFNAFFAACWLVYLVNLDALSAAAALVVPFLMMFGMGVLLFLNTSRINYRIMGPLSIAGLVLTLFTPPIAIALHFIGTLHLQWDPSLVQDEVLRALFTLFLPFFVIYLAQHVRPALVMKADFSFGIYLFHWPVLQGVIWYARHHDIAFTPIVLFLLCLGPVLALAALSWFLIEKPSLRLKNKFHARRTLQA